MTLTPIYSAAQVAAIAVFCIAALLNVCSSSARTIREDHGGRLIDYMLAAAQAREKNERVVIDGYCASACTLYLSTNYCATRRAVLGFHSATDRRANKYLLRAYPAAVRSWIKRNGGLTKRLLKLKGPELKQHVRMCR